MAWYVVTGVVPAGPGEPPKPGSRPVWGPYDTREAANRPTLRVPGTYIVEAADKQQALELAFGEAGLPLPASSETQSQPA